MAFDARVAERVRRAIGPRPDLDERRMFGGLTFLLGGKMFVGVQGEELMVRVGKARHAWALARPHARPMVFTGRPLGGVRLRRPRRLRHGQPARHVDRGCPRERRHAGAIRMNELRSKIFIAAPPAAVRSALLGERPSTRIGILLARHEWETSVRADASGTLLIRSVRYRPRGGRLGALLDRLILRARLQRDLRASLIRTRERAATTR